jgi:hypothetical protein
LAATSAVLVHFPWLQKQGMCVGVCTLQVLVMASKLPEGMQSWKQTVLMQVADSAATVFRQTLQPAQHPQQQQQQQQQPPQQQPSQLQLGSGSADPLRANLASPPPADSTTGTPAPEPAAVMLADPAGNAVVSADLTQQDGDRDGDVLPGLLAAAQNHPQLRSMPADKGETLLKQLLQQHQARRSRSLAGQGLGSMAQHQQQLGLMHANSLADSGRAGSVGAGGLDWNSFAQQQPQQQQQHGSMPGMGMNATGDSGADAAGHDGLGWMQALAGPASNGPARRQQQQQQQQQQGGQSARAAAQTPHSGSNGYAGAFSGLEQQRSGLGNDPGFSAALGPAAVSEPFDFFAEAVGAGGVGGARSSGCWDNNSFLQGLRVGPGTAEAAAEAEAAASGALHKGAAIVSELESAAVAAANATAAAADASDSAPDLASMADAGVTRSRSKPKGGPHKGASKTYSCRSERFRGVYSRPVASAQHWTALLGHAHKVCRSHNPMCSMSGHHSSWQAYPQCFLLPANPAWWRDLDMPV